MAEEFKITQPVEYYKKFIEQNVRPDGRELQEIRPTTINIGSISTAEGSALVKLGNTTVICGIKALECFWEPLHPFIEELTTPKIETPKQGLIVPNVELPPLCSAQFRPGPPSEQAQVACQFMAEVLSCSECINLEDLCISEGKLVWVLYCDIVCLDYSGNLLDACTIAMLAALRNCELPCVTVNEETGLPETDEMKKCRLVLHHQPVSTSFAIFNHDTILVDPTQEEERLATGVITAVMVEGGQVCLLHKPGGSGVSEADLCRCTVRAKSRVSEVSQMIDHIIDNVNR